MVLAERNTDNVRNGRRSRGPSPNGQTESSSEEDGVPAEKIRVGRDYQVIVPEFIPLNERRLDQCPDRALLVWSPTTDIPDQKLDEYIILAKEKYGYNGEQALGMLFWHKHNLERAVLDLANFTPFPDEWTVEDKVLFEQAFQFHGKSFHRIRQMLPDKSIASLVKYYYSWKKTRTRTSLMDRQARKLNSGGKEGENGSENGSELGSNTDSESEDKKWTIHRGIRRGKNQAVQGSQGGDAKASSDSENMPQVQGACSNCGVACHSVRTTPKGHACHSCYLHWRRTGVARPLSSVPGRSNKRKPPRGLVVNHDDLAALAGQPNQANNSLQAIDTEIVSLKRQIQSNKQQVSGLKRKTTDGIDDLRPPEVSSRINARWTNDELLLAVQGVRKYGKDFSAIADVIGTKTEAHLRSFFVNYRRRYNLDAVLKEYEAENGPILIDDEKDEKMEVDQVQNSENAETSQKAKASVAPGQTTK
ncbi:REST corepressor 1 isoform X1 [Neodiprion pinetum]|uniref:REST corepressor 3 isoform X2 n=1 Tax=Neodiprion lecontei TaxID=441921 RepID=A0A6J0BHM9_NEOLC|nr:REST corepressor 3 isoform X2 [Neodiprion lecontei]XP_046431106.1 REST corepressor 3 isoform X2 [Neodiprion fabricii]XP_046488706.1 REST corepressor 3 isoform X1 [Neodiprion pinetum]XP_046624884.1 REST corepressor 3 isoform X1 [Neodiprion virginianus]